MIRVALLGQGFWAKRLQRTLAQYVPGQVDTQPVVARSLLSPEDIRRIRRSEAILRIGYRPGSPTPLGRAFDAFWSALRKLAPQAKAVHYWIGSDVMRTLQDSASGRIRPGPFAAARSDYHLADAPWLADELATVGIGATVLAIPAPNLRSDAPAPLPAAFRVLSFIPDLRFRFYGGEAVCEAARRLPKVEFHAVGGTGRWVRHRPANLHFHGWQSDMAAFYRDSSVLLRIVEHDSVGVTVKEALSFGRYVICNYPVPHTEQVGFEDVDGLVQHLAELEALHRCGSLQPNVAGWQYAIREFDEARDARTLVSYLRETVAGTGHKELYVRA